MTPEGWFLAKVGSPDNLNSLKVTTFWPFCQGLKSGKDLGFGTQKSVKIWYVLAKVPTFAFWGLWGLDNEPGKTRICTATLTPFRAHVVGGLAGEGYSKPRVKW